MREINPDKANTKSQNVIILHNDPRQQQLVKVNRYLVYSVMVLMTLVVVLGFMLWPAENPLNDFKPTATTQFERATPPLSAEISILKGQVAGLVGGSIESKLRVLEESVRSGHMNNALGTIQDLKREVHVLQAYSEPQTLKEPPKVATDFLLQEVSHLKNLVYLTLASVSLIFAAVAGIWFGKRYRLTHQRKAYLPQEKQH